jgi:hypothetical protein
MPFGTCPYLVKRGGLEVLHSFSIQRTGGKTASFLREALYMSLSEVPALSTSPNMKLMAYTLINLRAFCGT